MLKKKQPYNRIKQPILKCQKGETWILVLLKMRCHISISTGLLFPKSQQFTVAH